MKKALVLLSVFIAALALPLFADDALVMPKGVFRTYLTMSYASFDEAYDDEGEKQDADEVGLGILGTVLEFGITEWITGAIQWAPGYNFYTKIKDADEASMNGPFDLKLGAKIQIVGPEAPVQSDKMRFTVTPGFKIPIGGSDGDDEFENLVAGDDFIAQDPDKHAWAIGSQASFDYVINEMFYLNAYGEFMKFFEKKDVAFDAMTQMAYYMAYGSLPGKVDIDYGYKLTLQLEPHFGMPLGPGQFSASLPVTYVTSPATKYNGEDGDVDPSYTLTLEPSASYLFKAGALPLETKLGYSIPLAGKLDYAMSTATFQLKVYFQF